MMRIFVHFVLLMSVFVSTLNAQDRVNKGASPMLSGTGLVIMLDGQKNKDRLDQTLQRSKLVSELIRSKKTGEIDSKLAAEFNKLSEDFVGLREELGGARECDQAFKDRLAWYQNEDKLLAWYKDNPFGPLTWGKSIELSASSG